MSGPGRCRLPCRRRVRCYAPSSRTNEGDHDREAHRPHQANNGHPEMLRMEPPGTDNPAGNENRLPDPIGQVCSAGAREEYAGRTQHDEDGAEQSVAQELPINYQVKRERSDNAPRTLRMTKTRSKTELARYIPFRNMGRSMLTKAGFASASFSTRDFGIRST